MENGTILDQIGKVLKKSRGEPLKFIELISCILDLNREGKRATCPKVVRALWSEEWKEAEDKVEFEKVKWNLLCKRRREINERTLKSDMCFSFFIELTKNKQFEIVSEPKEIYERRIEELELNLARAKSKSERNKIEKLIDELREKFQTIKQPKAAAHAGRWKWAVIAIAFVFVIAFMVFFVRTFYLKPTTLKEDQSPYQTSTPKIPDQPSIAVLPFENMSGDPEQEYFGDGISEEIITALSKLPSLLVIARNSSFSYKGKATKVQDIGKELGVRYILEGSVRKEGDRVRITTQLIDAVNGYHLWSERYDRDLKDIFALQDEITMKIITELQIKLTGGDKVRLYAKGTDDLEAYIKFLQGFHYYIQLNPEGNMEARRIFEEVITHDSNYADVYALLAHTYLLEVIFGRSESQKESFEKAYELAEKAISIDENSPQARIALGFVYLQNAQHEKAVSEFRQVTKNYPNLPLGHQSLGRSLERSGRPEDAIPHLMKALRLNPKIPGRTDVLGEAYRSLGRYEEAIQALKEAVRFQPNRLSAHINLAACYAALGREKEARAEVEEVLRIDPQFSLEKFGTGEPYKNPADAKKFIDLLRKAGLPS